MKSHSEGTAFGVICIFLAPLPLFGLGLCLWIQGKSIKGSNAHTLSMIGSVIAGLATAVTAILILATISLRFIFRGLMTMSDESNFRLHRSDFERAASDLLAKKAIPIRNFTHEYDPTPELSEIGINGIIDEGEGIICFSYSLERFDGPTRLLLCDPHNSIHGNFSRWISGRLPSLARWSIDKWTYIENDD